MSPDNKFVQDIAPRTEIRLAGEGGQGMILAGIILAEAATIHDGPRTLQFRPRHRFAAPDRELSRRSRIP
jgi:hypothetical protein